ncbi:MAG: hypothetical protein L0211_00705 [Planctomycetaceae bacterium]|nr:hypothetical protein [Planctomycetaceae bacterium]
MERVPNLFTFGALGAALLTALIAIEPGLVATAGGGLKSSLICGVATLVVLLPLYCLGVMPAACVKAQTAFAAWVGCTLPVGAALFVVQIATLEGILISALGFGLAMLRQSKAHAIPLLSAPTDLEDDEPFATAQPEMYAVQITLSLGSIGGILALAPLALGRLAG